MTEFFVSDKQTLIAVVDWANRQVKFYELAANNFVFSDDLKPDRIASFKNWDELDAPSRARQVAAQIAKYSSGLEDAARIGIMVTNIPQGEEQAIKEIFSGLNDPARSSMAASGHIVLASYPESEPAKEDILGLADKLDKKASLGRQGDGTENLVLVRADFAKGVVQVETFQNNGMQDGTPNLQKLHFKSARVDGLTENGLVLTVIKRQVLRALGDQFPNGNAVISVVATGIGKAEERAITGQIEAQLEDAIGIKQSMNNDTIARAQSFADSIGPDRHTIAINRTVVKTSALQSILAAREPEHERVIAKIEFKATIGNTPLMELTGDEVMKLAQTRVGAGKGGMALATA